MKKFLLLLASISFLNFSYSQEIDKLDFNLNLETSHIWNGIIVSKAPAAGIDINYAFDKKNNLKLGVWGGVGLSDANGKHYQEVDYYFKYNTARWGLGIWDVFNNTDLTGKADEIFNYDNKTTGHRLDLRGYYVLSENFPLKLDVVTSFYGNDRNVKGDQTFSTYTGLTYSVLRDKKVDLDVFFGTAFNLGKGYNFYGDGTKDFDVVNFGLTVSKDVPVLGYKLPVSATAMWNPSRKEGIIHLSTQLF